MDERARIMAGIARGWMKAGWEEFYGRQGRLIRCKTRNTSGTPGIGWRREAGSVLVRIRQGDLFAATTLSGHPKKKPAIDIDAGFPCLLAPQLLGMDFVSE